LRERESEQFTWGREREKELGIDFGERERERERELGIDLGERKELTWGVGGRVERGIDLSVILVTETSLYLHKVNECNFVQ